MYNIYISCILAVFQPRTYPGPGRDEPEDLAKNKEYMLDVFFLR